MTKLDSNLSKKQSGNEKGEQGGEHETLQPDNDPFNPAAVTIPVDLTSTPTIMVGEIDLGLIGGHPKPPLTNDQQPTRPTAAYATFDWMVIRRVAMSQISLSLMAMICVVVSILSLGINCYKFTEFIMSLYLLVTAYSGLKGSAKSYKHLIVYLIMSALQWMINIVVLGCLTYAVYDTPYYTYNIRYAVKSIDFDDYGLGIGLLLMEVVSSAAMMGTIITGMLGLTACCKGFGNVLSYQEKFFQSQKNVETA